MLTNLRISLLIFAASVSYLSAQSLTMVSGNGQVVQSQFASTAPMVVQANNASGQPASGVAVTWKITQGSGTLEQVQNTTGANGQASIVFLATNVPSSESFFASTVTASASSGTVSFVITTVPSTTTEGQLAPEPRAFLTAPPSSNLSITGASGSTLAGAVALTVVAQSGPQEGNPVPNVGVRIVDYPPSTPSGSSVALNSTKTQCSATDGLVLTNNTGNATCNLTISAPPGKYQITALVGEYVYTPPFTLNVTQGVSCGFSLSSTNQSFPASGGSGTVNVITSAGCAWTAASNASFLSVTSGANGSGNGTVGFSVAANTGAARNGIFTIAGQTFTVNQSGSTPGSVTITSPPNLTPGNTGSQYSVQVSASGGVPPYTWSLTGSLPPGLNLNATQGVISGTPTTTGTYPFTLTVADSTGASAAQTFSITINPPSTSGFVITNTSFPAGAVGQAYSQLLTSSGGCSTPFSPSPAFLVSGGALPNGLTIQTNQDLSRSIVGTPTAAGTFNFTLTATDACANTTSASFSITISSTPGSPQMNVSAPTVSFTLQAGANNVPGTQTIAVTSSTSTAYSYTATASTQTGGSWLTIISGASGSTPGNIVVGLVNFSNLTPGPYAGAITIRSQAPNSPVVVSVNLTVLAAANLTLNPPSFTVTQIGSTGNTVARQLIVVNASPETTFTATETTQGGPWLTITPTQGTTPSGITAVVNGAGLTAGTYTGVITVTPAGGTPQVVNVTLDVLAPASIIGSPSPFAFTYAQGGIAPATQNLSLSSTGEVLSLSIGVLTKSGGPWLSVSPTTATTPGSIGVTVDPTGLAPDVYQGSVNISASDPTVAPLAVPVTLTVSKAAPVVGSITNAASSAPGPVAPGEFVTIFGSTLGPTTPASLELTASGSVATSLGGTQVFFDNTAAPLIYTSAGQVNAIVPYEIARKVNTELKVEYQGVVSLTQQVRVIESSPGIFVANSSGQGAILNQDGSPNSSQNGAEPGSVVSIFATGEGQTTPAGQDGVINGTKLPLPKPVLNVTVEINGENAVVQYAGAAPGQVAGMLQVNAVVPADVPRGGAVPVTISVGPATSQAGVTLAIHP